MRTVLLFCVLFIAIVSSVKAQSSPYRDNREWSPEGAIWLYMVSNNGYLGIKYTNDVVFKGKNVKQFSVYNIAIESNNNVEGGESRTLTKAGVEYQYMSNDSIYIYDTGLDKFVFLYHRNPQMGDVWYLETSYIDCVMQHYDTIGNNVVVGNTTLYCNGVAYETFTTNVGGRLFYNDIIPNLGSVFYFVPIFKPDSCGLMTSKYNSRFFGYSFLIGYEDSIRGFIRIAHDEQIVEEATIKPKTIIREINEYYLTREEPIPLNDEDAPFSIYPNPAHSALNIYSNGIAMEEIMIYDAVGRLVIHDKSRNQSIDINSLMSGLYIINIVDEYKQVSAFKFVKD